MSEDLPVFGWGESVTWSQGWLLVPLNRDGETVADLELSEAQAGELVDHLLDLIEPKPEPAQASTRAAGIWMAGIVPPDEAISRARAHYSECRAADQSGLDQLAAPDARAKVTYWRYGKQITVGER